ncbi:MAG TPA: GDSL-type esterase/lipase family protein [Pseudolabrys sp.]|jgi:lysophospholipase L1-like esterase|nr:GDSL-type esterase/lipase family protein [Pseudolabrys sp.]
MLAATLFAGLAFALPARADTSAPACATPLDLIRLANPLPHLAQKIAAGDAITIVAIGSSSTSGAGASSPAANYPSRLSVELQQHFPKSSFTMHNRGVNGEEIGDMLARFDSSVIAAKPDLVLWQLGTNAVIRGHQLGDHGLLIREGLAKIHAIGADVVLIDPQFAPKVIAKPDAESMVALISATAKQADVDLFRRFELMHHWRDVGHLAFETFVSPDGLHMNDWSYACMAKGLGNAIAEAAQRPVLSATALSYVTP